MVGPELRVRSRSDCLFFFFDLIVFDDGLFVCLCVWYPHSLTHVSFIEGNLKTSSFVMYDFFTIENTHFVALDMCPVPHPECSGCPCRLRAVPSVRRPVPRGRCAERQCACCGAAPVLLMPRADL